MYSQAQLQSFFGSNYDASSLPITFTYNGIMAIVPFLIIMVLFLIINHYKRAKGKINLSSTELVVYKSGSQEDRNNNKQNIKYYFNVYVKHPYNKNGKKNNYNNKSNHNYQGNTTDDIIDAAIL